MCHWRDFNLNVAVCLLFLHSCCLSLKGKSSSFYFYVQGLSLKVGKKMLRWSQDDRRLLFAISIYYLIRLEFLLFFKDFYFFLWSCFVNMNFFCSGYKKFLAYNNVVKISRFSIITGRRWILSKVLQLLKISSQKT